MQQVTSLVIVQPTPFCNIDCTYCYLPHRTDRKSLSIDKVGVLFERLASFPTIPERVTVVWHAGEPLVLGPKYYDEAFSRIRAVSPATVQFDHAMQTNGILLTEEW